MEWQQASPQPPPAPTFRERLFEPGFWVSAQGIALALLFFWPVGVYLLARYKPWTPGLRGILYTLFWPAGLVVLWCNPALSPRSKLVITAIPLSIYGSIFLMVPGDQQLRDDRFPQAATAPVDPVAAAPTPQPSQTEVLLAELQELEAAHTLGVQHTETLAVAAERMRDIRRQEPGHPFVPELERRLENLQDAFLAAVLPAVRAERFAVGGTSERDRRIHADMKRLLWAPENADVAEEVIERQVARKYGIKPEDAGLTYIRVEHADDDGLRGLYPRVERILRPALSGRLSSLNSNSVNNALVAQLFVPVGKPAGELRRATERDALVAMLVGLAFQPFSEVQVWTQGPVGGEVIKVLQARMPRQKLTRLEKLEPSEALRRLEDTFVHPSLH